MDNDDAGTLTRGDLSARKYSGEATRLFFETLFRPTVSVSSISRDETYWKSFPHLAGIPQSRKYDREDLPAVMEYIAEDG